MQTKLNMIWAWNQRAGNSKGSAPKLKALISLHSVDSPVVSDPPGHKAMGTKHLRSGFQNNKSSKQAKTPVTKLGRVDSYKIGPRIKFVSRGTELAYRQS